MAGALGREAGWWKVLLVASVLLAGGCATYPASFATPDAGVHLAVTEYPLFRGQATGIAVTGSGRIFANFPNWDKEKVPDAAVVEVLPGGVLKPYPDAVWSRWGPAEAVHPEAHFICVQSVVAHGGALWILDPASPSFSGVVPGGAKLVKVDLATGVVDRVYHFPEQVAPRASYLNDIRIDPDGTFAYLTDSGLGAIVVLDLTTGIARRVLATDASTKAEPGYVPVIGGKPLRDASGGVPQIHADGLALDREGEYLYYHALTARTLYRIGTTNLKNTGLGEAELAMRVEKLANTGAVDGMAMDDNDNLYLTALEDNAITCYHPDGSLTTIVKDDHFQWPDSIALLDGEFLYFTVSQIHLMPRFNNGKDLRIVPYSFYRVWLHL